MTFEIDAREVTEGFGQFAEMVEVQTDPATYEIAQRVQAEALERVARRTGQTARGIVIETSEQGSGYVVAVRRDETPNLPWWLEAGTVNMDARPFLYPAADLEERNFQRLIIEAIDEAIDQVGFHA